NGQIVASALSKATGTRRAVLLKPISPLPPGRAWVFTDGTGTTLLPNLPGKANGFAWEINDGGQVAGSSGFESIEPPERTTRWTSGVPQDLGTLGTDSRAYSVNNFGHVAGSSTVSNPHGFFWSDATGIVDIA